MKYILYIVHTLQKQHGVEHFPTVPLVVAVVAIVVVVVVFVVVVLALILLPGKTPWIWLHRVGL